MKEKTKKSTIVRYIQLERERYELPIYPLAKYLAMSAQIDAKIAAECDPQDVYDYEFDNHECCYTYDDSIVMATVKAIFGQDVNIERKINY